jgi:HTH-type transcriptional regulator / antitoxin HipB
MHDRSDLSLAEAVRVRRKQLGLRQQDLAELAGVATRSVHALETGKLTVRLGLTLTLVPIEPAANA